MIIKEHFLTIGLFDKDTEKQEVTEEKAKVIISETLINTHGIFAFTMYSCNGVYKMNSNGNIISEPSIRIEIADTENKIERENIYSICNELKNKLNQETIMYKMIESDIDFF